jgi:hypothetical protein
VLLQFFVPTNPQPNDVLAWHYFDNKIAWDRLRPKMPQALRDVNTRVGREIVHLTYGRLDVLPEAKHWDVPAIHAAIMALLELFVRTAAEANLAPSLLALTAPTTLLVQPHMAPSATNVNRINTPSVNPTYRAISTK